MREIKNWQLWIGLGYAFTVSLWPLLPTLMIALWVLVSLVALAMRKQKFRGQPALLLMAGFYFVYAGSVFLGNTFALHILEHKLSLLLFPLIFSLQDLDGQACRKLMRAFVFGLFTSGLICLSRAGYRAIEFTGGTLSFDAAVLEGKGFMESILYGGNYFFGRHFSFLHQTVYYALYLNVGLVFLAYGRRLFPVKIRLLLALFFVILVFLISNKAGLFTLGLLGLIYLHQSIKDRRVRLVAVLLLLAGIAALVFANPRSRLTLFKLGQGQIQIDKDARYGIATRLLSWDTALDLIGEAPVSGYGVAQTQEELNQAYSERGYNFPLKEKLNAHNQFLQSWLELGLLGLILWCLLIVILFYRGLLAEGPWKWIVLSLAGVVLVNALFESVLNRFSGISFLAFLYCFLVTASKSQRQR